MATYTHAERPLSITTPLGKDALLITGLHGHEAISELFHFKVDLLAAVGTPIPFDQVLGQSVTAEMRLVNGDKRYFNGLVKRLTQGARDENFVKFRAEVVPKLWLLTKKVRSRIFQHLTTQEILQQVFSGVSVSYKLLAHYYPRDYCVQYRESDFDFASRLMEEEGMHYFFRHADGSHEMVVTDATTQNPSIPGSNSVIYEEARGEVREDMRVTAWQKSQELRSGEYTLWDHCFELPTNHLEAKEKIGDSVKVGKITHKFHVGGNDQLEIYDYPGAYAQRFDGIDSGGGDRPKDLKNIFEDRDRTVRIRMEGEETAGLEIEGTSDCGNFSAGHKFSLESHFDADGKYLLTRIEHDARQGDYRSDESETFHYENRFWCLPDALRYRPPRTTRKPVIAGIQTATVVGPPGEEIFVDKYGRVKVQFHWDREGKRNAGSSCWLRVAQVWAGKRWGAFFWPRIGHEVVVVFEEGDPDQPLIAGSVYNAENMPWFTLPLHKDWGGFKSASFRGTAQENYNGIVFNDEKGHEHLSIHSEHNMSLNAEYDKMFHAGRHKGERVSSANILTVGRVLGGGSGGGSFDAGNTIPEPPPIGVVGLNSVMVYGQNLQVAAGLNHQLAIGNNFQLCINPLGLAAGVPGMPAAKSLTTALGAGLGGNMQFTVGTSANFVLGQQFDINLGPPKIEISGPYSDHPATVILCGALSAAAMAWVILYYELTEDHDRATLAIVFQTLVDALLIAILGIEMSLKAASRELISKASRVVPVSSDNSDWGALKFGAGAATLAAMLAPLEAAGGE